MSAGHTKSQALWERAAKVLPRGVSSNFRYWGDYMTPMAARAKDGHLWDADGKRYIDYRLGFGPVILGHAQATVDDAVREAVNDGTIYALTTEREVRVAEKIVEMVPGVDQVRFANSGSEATMHALRVARAYTGRGIEHHPDQRDGQPSQPDPCQVFIGHPSRHLRVDHHPAL